MIDPFTLAQTHPSLETHYPVQTHTMLEKTNTAQIGGKQLQWRARLVIARLAAVQRKYLIEIQHSWLFFRFGVELKRL